MVSAPVSYDPLRKVRGQVNARGKIEAWRKEYNEERPHSSLGYETPAAFARRLWGQVILNGPLILDRKVAKAAALTFKVSARHNYSVS
jgi:Integrase core domain